MTNTTKITKAMALNAITSILATLDNDTKVDNVSLDDMNAYCENELALLAKKKSSTSKESKANAETRMTCKGYVAKANAETRMTCKGYVAKANAETRMTCKGYVEFINS